MADMKRKRKRSRHSRKNIDLAGDCISSLPDVILQHILSNVETKFAIRTSVLSKRWKNVWRETPSISIDCNRCSRGVDPNSIHKTLSSFCALKITSFDVNMRHGVTATHINSWIELAMSRNAEDLSLRFNPRYNFPDFFFINFSVKQLRLTLGLGDMSPTCVVSWTSLRSLSLDRCNLSNESIANMLSGCPMLESLTLRLRWKPNHIDLSKSPRLTRLEIVCSHLMRGEGPVKIVAPHIRYLSLSLALSKHPCILLDVSSLNEVNLNTVSLPRGFYDVDFDLLHDMVLKILTKLQNIEKLTIDAVVLQFISLAELRPVPFPQFKIKDLTVETMVVPSVNVNPGIVRLLQNSSGLKKITIHTTKHRVRQDKELDVYFNRRCSNPHQRMNVGEGRRFLYGTVDTESKDVASVIELVLQTAETVETMVLRLGGYLNATEYEKLLPTLSSRNKMNIKITP